MIFIGGEDAEVFRNRKLYFSLNTQVVCDSHLKINNIVARWPGSAHDITIYNNSRIRGRCEAGEFGNSVLLGKYLQLHSLSLNDLKATNCDTK